MLRRNTEDDGASRPMGWLRKGAALTALLGLIGCAEVAEILLDSDLLRVCAGCNWIIQEWDYPGWTTHNSTQYETEEICQAALARQSAQSPSRGHRCVYEGDLFDKTETHEELPHCYGCDWAVEVEQASGWTRVESATYINEGVCQQASWQLSKSNPYQSYRCVNLDVR